MQSNISKNPTSATNHIRKEGKQKRANRVTKKKKQVKTTTTKRAYNVGANKSKQVWNNVRKEENNI